MASSRSRRRRCRFCKELFFPDPRLKERQIACSKPDCQCSRRKHNQEDWLVRHPGYFNGRYFNTKTWRQEHPVFQRHWRKEHPEARARDNKRRRRSRELARVARAEIQDSISLQKLVAKAVRPHLARIGLAEIQDSISPQVIALSIFTSRYVPHLQSRDTRLDRLGGTPPLPSSQDREGSPRDPAILECPGGGDENTRASEATARPAAHPSGTGIGLQLD